MMPRPLCSTSSSSAYFIPFLLPSSRTDEVKWASYRFDDLWSYRHWCHHWLTFRPTFCDRVYFSCNQHYNLWWKTEISAVSSHVDCIFLEETFSTHTILFLWTLNSFVARKQVNNKSNVSNMQRVMHKHFFRKRVQYIEIDNMTVR
jgi:hypothetical protein